MKITSFNPQIITNEPDQLIELFEILGFERKHEKTGIGEKNVVGIAMKDPNGFKLDISVPEVHLPKDIMSIRMNVDNFDEVCALLVSHGFKKYYGEGKVVNTASSKSALMIAPSGYCINLIEHIKVHN